MCSRKPSTCLSDSALCNVSRGRMLGVPSSPTEKRKKWTLLTTDIFSKSQRNQYATNGVKIRELFRKDIGEGRGSEKPRLDHKSHRQGGIFCCRMKGYLSIKALTESQWIAITIPFLLKGPIFFLFAKYSPCPSHSSLYLQSSAPRQQFMTWRLASDWSRQ